MRRFVLGLIISLSSLSCTNNNKVNSSKENEPHLDEMKLSQCVENCREPEKITWNTFKDNILELKFGKYLGCLDKKCEVKVSKDSLFLNFAPKDSIDVACYCYFNVEVVVSGLVSSPKIILVNGKQIGDLKWR